MNVAYVNRIVALQNERNSDTRRRFRDFSIEKSPSGCAGRASKLYSAGGAGEAGAAGSSGGFSLTSSFGCD